MKLKALDTATVLHRVELSSHYDGLTKSGPAWVEAEIKAGGHLNPELVTAVEAVGLSQEIAADERKGMPAPERIEAERAANLDAGNRIIKAHYDYCVVSWSTNIIDAETGSPIDPNWDNFWDLFNANIPDVALWVSGIPKRAAKISDFIRAKDVESEKN